MIGCQRRVGWVQNRRDRRALALMDVRFMASASLPQLEIDRLLVAAGHQNSARDDQPTRGREPVELTSRVSAWHRTKAAS